MALPHKSETLKLKMPNFSWKNMFSEVFFPEKKSRKNSEDSPQKQKLLPLGGSNILL
jgi:hypothetical protein